MKLLITGATGFVGGWLCKKLLQENHELRILHRTSSDLSDIDGLEYESFIGDVTDLNSLKKACQNVDSVFHLAGVVGYSKAARPLMQKVNVEGTKNLLEACIQNNIHRILHFSSVVAIGSSFKSDTILNEESPFNIHHLNLGYFETKHQAENLVLDATKSGRIEAVIVNPSTIYGPADAKKGSRKTQVKVAKGNFPFFTSGGVNIASVYDVVDATYQAWKSGTPGKRHILAGENITIKQLFEYIAECAQVPPPKIFLPNALVHAIGKVGDLMEGLGKKGPLNSENAWTSTMYHWFDSTKAQAELGLRVTPAKECIKTSVDWMRSNGII